jgi:tyrosyl-tRNA synthetase
MQLSQELAWRGFVNQTTFDDIALLDGAPMTFYFGVDPSADSMTIGHLATAMMLKHLINHGHKAILLVGGATGLIGDPDGKAQERDLKTLEQIAHNKAGIAAQYDRIFEGQPFTVVDNYDWFKGLGYLEFLRDVGKHVPMRQMLGREFVQTRLREDGGGISYAEFSYVLIQAYDFLHLHKEKGATLQVCGADQWGNSVAGVDLIRRLSGDEAHVLSAPLIINKATGKKFGKTEDGAIWLDANKTSPYQFYQFWLNVDDEGAGGYLKIYTMLPKIEVEKTMADFAHNPSKRAAQKTLAYEVTKLVHGQKTADSVRNATEVLFGSGDFRSLGKDELAVLKAELPLVKPSPNLAITLASAGLAASASDARRLISSGAIWLNGQRVASADYKIQPGTNLLKRGKNQFAIVEA